MKSSKQNKQAKFLKNIIKKKTQQVFFAKIFSPPVCCYTSLFHTHTVHRLSYCVAGGMSDRDRHSYLPTGRQSRWSEHNGGAPYLPSFFRPLLLSPSPRGPMSAAPTLSPPSPTHRNQITHHTRLIMRGRTTAILPSPRTHERCADVETIASETVLKIYCDFLHLAQTAHNSTVDGCEQGSRSQLDGAQVWTRIGTFRSVSRGRNRLSILKVLYNEWFERSDFVWNTLGLCISNKPLSNFSNFHGDFPIVKNIRKQSRTFFK